MQSVIIHIKDRNIASNRTGVSKLFRSLKDGKYEVTIKRVGKRSISQNKYYWGVVVAMIKEALIELGNDVDSNNVHDFLKDRFNSKDLFTKDGTVIGTIGDTTTHLTTVAFMDYLEKCKQFASEILGIYIPEPNEQVALWQ